jgi:hypothetical protein
MVPYAEQVQRLMQSALDEARRFRKHTIPLPPSAWALEPLDFIAWTSNRNGYDGKTFRIDLATDMASLEMVLVITEVDPSDYDWDPTEDYIERSSGPLIIARTPSQPMAEWAVEPATIWGDDGKAKPGIQVSWATAEIDDVDGVIIEIRLASSGNIVWSGETPHSIEQFDIGSFIPAADLVGNTAYQVRGKFRPISTRATDWSDWLDVTTPDIRIGALEIYDGAISRAKLDEALKGYNGFMGQQTRDLLDELATVSQAVAEAGLGSAIDDQILRTELRSSYGNLKADYTSQIEVATGPDSALSQRIDTLSASVTDIDSSVVANATALSALTTRVDTAEGDITTLSGQYTSLSATVAGKADARAVDALTTRVDVTEDNISTLSSEYLALSGTVAGKADSSTVAALSSTVLSQGTDITANSSAILDLQDSVGNVAGSGLFRVDVLTTPAGYDSRIGLTAAGSSGGSSSSASIYIDAKSGSPSRVLLVADQVAITDGSDLAALSDAFLFSGGQLLVKNATIVNLTVDNLQYGAATNTNSSTGGSATISDGNWHDVATCTLTTIGGRVLLLAQAQFNTSKTGSPFADYGNWQMLMDGSLVADGSNSAIGHWSVPTSDVIGLNYAPNTFMFAFTPAAGSHTFKLQCSRATSNTISIIAGFMHAFESRS